MEKKYCSDSRVALQPPIPLHTVGQRKCFWITRMGVFKTDDAEKYCVDSGVALQPPIPLHIMSQQRCFWVPGMVVFETHVPKHPYHCTLPSSKSVFGYLDGDV